MVTFAIHDMTCGHCAGSIGKAIRFADPGARVQVDLAARQVQIEPTEASTDELADAIREAGYTPVQVPAAEPAAAVPAKRAGCCCG